MRTDMGMAYNHTLFLGLACSARLSKYRRSSNSEWFIKWTFSYEQWMKKCKNQGHLWNHIRLMIIIWVAKLHFPWSRPSCNDRLYFYFVNQFSDFAYSVVVAQWVRLTEMLIIWVTRSAGSGDIWIKRQDSIQLSLEVWQIFTSDISNTSRERIPQVASC